MHSNTASAWLVREPLSIFSVHLGEVIHAGKENLGTELANRSFSAHASTYCDLDNLLYRATASFQNSFHILAASFSLFGNWAFNELASWVGWELSWDPDLASSLDSLWIWCSGCGFVSGWQFTDSSNTMQSLDTRSGWAESLSSCSSLAASHLRGGPVFVDTFSIISAILIVVVVDIVLLRGPKSSCEFTPR